MPLVVKLTLFIDVDKSIADLALGLAHQQHQEPEDERFLKMVVDQHLLVTPAVVAQQFVEVVCVLVRLAVDVFEQNHELLPKHLYVLLDYSGFVKVQRRRIWVVLPFSPELRTLRRWHDCKLDVVMLTGFLLNFFPVLDSGIK